MDQPRSRVVRACSLALALAGVVSLMARANAQIVRPSLNLYVPGTMGIPQPEPLITLSIKQPRSLARVLYEVFKQTTFEYALLADVGTTAFTVDVNRVPLTKALATILAQDKRAEDPLVYSFEKSLTGKGGTFKIDREFAQIGLFEGEKKVSLANARITRVLPDLFKLMQVDGRIEADVPPVTMSMELRPEEWSQVLPQLMIEASKKEPALTYSLPDEKTVIVHLQRTPTGAPGSPLPSGTMARRVKLAVADTPLKDALAQLFMGSAWKYQVADAVADVKISYTTANEPELAALQAVLKAASFGGKQVTYREGKGMLYIEPGPLPGDFQVSRRGLGGMPKTSLNQSGQKLKRVIDLLAGALNTKVTVAPNVPDIPVTVKLENVTIAEGLAQIVAAARTSLPNLNFRPQGTGYIVELSK
jgi:hypothetical protein